MLRDQYYRLISALKSDLAHVEFHMDRETDPRELATLRKLRRELLDKVSMYEYALKTMVEKPPHL